MKLAAGFLVVLGIAFAGDAVVDQYSGHARAISPGRRARIVQAERDRDPREFRSIMTYQWIRTFAVLAGGAFLLAHVRRSERTDIA